MEPTLGALAGDGGCAFEVWGPRVRSMQVHLTRSGRLLDMARDEDGYHRLQVEGVAPGERYLYRLDGGLERPDPASRFQPEGVHGPSEVVPIPSPSAPAFPGVGLDRLVLYELHVGTFSVEGTFDGVEQHLDALGDLGVTAVEIMPVAQFPGARNWGYDGVYPFAAQSSYGGPAAFARLVDACHRRCLAVVLDVVYNHLGPEGNYLHDFGPYFTGRYRTPWGDAVNFDGRESDHVRRFFLENAVWWVRHLGVDGLRVDAVHAIVDTSARPFLEELAGVAHAEGARAGREVLVIGESAANDPRLVREPPAGGLGFDAQWADGLHHALHVALTGERDGYYRDFSGVRDVALALRQGYVYTGQYSPFYRRRHGAPPSGVASSRFVVASQNHDQVGNRRGGDRLATIVAGDALRVAVAIVLLSPFVPLLFAGEEYGETAPFPYFVSHGDADLVEAVRRGRREEFARFAWSGEAPDPQAESTFRSAILSHARDEAPGRQVWSYYRELLRLRREQPALRILSFAGLEADADESTRVLTLCRRAGGDDVRVLAHLGDGEAPVALPPGTWQLLLDSAAETWGGAGRPIPGSIEAGELVLDGWRLVVLRREVPVG